MEDKRHTLISVLLCLLELSQVLVTIAEVRFEPRRGIFWFREGRPLSITCTANTTDESATLDITAAGNLKVDKFKSDMTKEKLPDGTFKLTRTISTTSASKEDSTNYVCTLFNGNAVFQLNEESVFQTYELFTVFTQGANVTEGQETQIRCEPHVSEELLIGWYKNNVHLASVPGLEGRVTISQDNKTVSFKDAKSTDGGAYTCRIELSTPYSPNSTSQIFEEDVFLQAKPYILPGALTNVTNATIVLTCPVVGYPAPEVFWQRGKDVLTSKGNVHLTTVGGQRVAKLVITNASDSDYGTYTCIADNWLGKAEFSYQVNSGLTSGANAGHRPGTAAGFFLLIILFGLIHVTMT